MPDTVLTEEQQNELMNVIESMKTFSDEFEGSVSEMKQAQEKMAQDLESHITSTKDFQSVTEATLEKLEDEKDKTDKDVFDIVMKEVNIRKQWGYKDPIERAIYTPRTVWSRQKGWTMKEGYPVDDIVMQMNDALYLIGAHKVMQEGGQPANAKHMQQQITSLETYKLFNYELQRNSELRKALDTGTAGSGSEWVPTGFSAKLIDDVRLKLKVAAMFNRITIPAKVGSYTSPLRGSRRRAYILGEAASDSATKYPTATPPTGDLTFSAVKHGVRMLFSDEMEEDSAIAIMPLVREEIVQAISDGEEDATINGDDATTHQDSDVTASNDVRKSWDGLRLHAGGSSGQAAVDISTFSADNLRSIEKGMGRFGVNPAERFWLTSISAYIQWLKMDELLTLDKLGAKATILTGQLGQFDGSPVIVSEFMRQDLNTSGVYDGTTETDTIILLVNRPSFWYADKPGGVKIETRHDIEVGQQIAVGSRRLDFKQAVTPAASGEETVGLGYSLTK